MNLEAVACALVAGELGGAFAKRALDASEPVPNRPSYMFRPLTSWLYPLAWPVILPLMTGSALKRNSRRIYIMQLAEFILVFAAGMITFGVTLYGSSQHVSWLLSVCMGAIACAIVLLVGTPVYRAIQSKRSFFHGYRPPN